VLRAYDKFASQRGKKPHLLPFGMLSAMALPICPCGDYSLDITSTTKMPLHFLRIHLFPNLKFRASELTPFLRGVLLKNCTSHNSMYLQRSQVH